MSRRKAIRARCLDCSCFSPSEVRDCTFTDCQLYPFRMGTEKQDPKLRNKAIREYCKWCMAGSSYEVAKCHLEKCSLHQYRNTGSMLKKRHMEQGDKRTDMRPCQTMREMKT